MTRGVARGASYSGDVTLRPHSAPTGNAAASFGASGNDYGVVDLELRYVGDEGKNYVWSELSFSNAQNGQDTSRMAMLSVGYDRLLNSDFALGVMAQFDSGSNRAVGSDLSTSGYLIGPYLSAEISEEVFVAARFGVGRSSTDAKVDVLGDGQMASATIEADRAILAASIYGRNELGGLTIIPGLAGAWAREAQQDYRTDTGVDVTGSRIEIAALTGSVGFEFELREDWLMTVTPQYRHGLFTRLDGESLERKAGEAGLDLELRTGIGSDFAVTANLGQMGIGADMPVTRIGLSIEYRF